MSLKAVHILFITLACLLSFGYGVWSLGEYRTAGNSGMMFSGVLGFVVGAGLIVYGIKFYQKIKTLS